MLLALDVGNTNTVLGVFRDKDLIANWRLTTARDQTVDEYGILTRDLFTIASLDPNEIHGVIISSVVPPLNSTLAGMADRYFHTKALFVEPGIRTGMPVHYDNPQEVGADRIVNSVAAYSKYGGPCIIVDFGTAINFDVVSERGEYLARAGDCVSCHTASGGAPYAGGLRIDTPFGYMLAPNITPDPATGIGRWSEAAFARAMHQDVARDAGAQQSSAVPPQQAAAEYESVP